MWLMENFINDFRFDFIRMLDQDFAPNSGTEIAHEVKMKMRERPAEIKLRADTENAIVGLKKSLAEIEAVNRKFWTENLSKVLL